MFRYIKLITMIISLFSIIACSGRNHKDANRVSAGLLQPRALMSECPPDGESHHTQRGLNGVIPGSTLEEELPLIFGEPYNVGLTGSGKRQYVFESITSDGVGASIFIDAGKVEYIVSWGWRSDDAPDNAGTVSRTVADVIAEHGCPDFVFLESLGTPDISDGNYNAGRLVYLQKGMEFTFNGMPLMLHAPSDYTIYFMPVSQSEYLKLYGYGDTSTIFTWSQAITWKPVRP